MKIKTNRGDHHGRLINWDDTMGAFPNTMAVSGDGANEPENLKIFFHRSSDGKYFEGICTHSENFVQASFVAWNIVECEKKIPPAIGWVECVDSNNNPYKGRIANLLWYGTGKETITEMGGWSLKVEVNRQYTTDRIIIHHYKPHFPYEYGLIIGNIYDKRIYSPLPVEVDINKFLLLGEGSIRIIKSGNSTYDTQYVNVEISNLRGPIMGELVGTDRPTKTPHSKRQLLASGESFGGKFVYSYNLLFLSYE